MEDSERPRAPLKRAHSSAKENSMNQYLTNNQQQLLDYITDEIDRTGKAPTHFEIARSFQFQSLRVVSQHLKILEQKGWILCQPLQARGISLTENVRDYRLALLGDVVEEHVAFRKSSII